MNEHEEAVAILDACKAGYLPELKRLLNSNNKDMFIAMKCTAVEACCRFGNFACVQWLVEELGVSLGNAINYACHSDINLGGQCMGTKGRI